MKDSKRNRANAKRVINTPYTSKYAAKKALEREQARLDEEKRKFEAWQAHNNAVLMQRLNDDAIDHEEWLDENFGNECLNCGGSLGHSHIC